MARPPFLIRLATAEDHDGVEALLQRSYPTLLARAYPPDLLALTLPHMTRANPALLASNRYFVVESEGRITGCGGYSWQAPGTGTISAGRIHIRHVATDPQLARRGIATALFNAATEQAGREGASEIEALSTLVAEPFYRRMGLARYGTTDVPMGASALPSITMRGAIA